MCKFLWIYFSNSNHYVLQHLRIQLVFYESSEFNLASINFMGSYVRICRHNFPCYPKWLHISRSLTIRLAQWLELVLVVVCHVAIFTLMQRSPCGDAPDSTVSYTDSMHKAFTRCASGLAESLYEKNIRSWSGFLAVVSKKTSIIRASSGGQHQRTTGEPVERSPWDSHSPQAVYIYESECKSELRIASRVQVAWKAQSPLEHSLKLCYAQRTARHFLGNESHPSPPASLSFNWHQPGDKLRRSRQKKNKGRITLPSKSMSSAVCSVL